MKNPKKNLILALCAACTFSISAQSLSVQNSNTGSKLFSADKDIFGTRTFIENTGQFENPVDRTDKVHFVYQQGGEKIFFTSGGLIYDIAERPHHKNNDRDNEEEENGKERKHIFVEMNWLNASENISLEKI